MSNELTKEKETVISFKNVTKEYKLYKNEKARFRGMFNKKVPFKLKRAVDNLSFEVKKGDGLALIGRNGAGKPLRRSGSNGQKVIIYLPDHAGTENRCGTLRGSLDAGTTEYPSCVKRCGCHCQSVSIG